MPKYQARIRKYLLILQEYGIHGTIIAQMKLSNEERR
jgi:hypothetical protein